jgi:hypothetical protein
LGLELASRRTQFHRGAIVPTLAAAKLMSGGTAAESGDPGASGGLDEFADHRSTPKISLLGARAEVVDYLRVGLEHDTDYALHAA